LSAREGEFAPGDFLPELRHTVDAVHSYSRLNSVNCPIRVISSIIRQQCKPDAQARRLSGVEAGIEPGGGVGWGAIHFSRADKLSLVDSYKSEKEKAFPVERLFFFCIISIFDLC
jgi:hypothetical protein